MAQDVVSLLFPGDAEQLLPRYRDGAVRWQDDGGVPPEQAVVALAETWLIVTLVWGDDVPHDRFGAHMVKLLSELQLPFPQVTHGVLAAADWDQLTGTGSSQLI